MSRSAQISASLSVILVLFVTATLIWDPDVTEPRKPTTVTEILAPPTEHTAAVVLSVHLPPPPRPRAPLRSQPQPKPVPAKAAPAPRPQLEKSVAHPNPAVRQQKKEARARKVVAKAAPATVIQGRTLLRLMEHGKGPSIEIAWPASIQDRAQLYRMFHTCFGMRTVLMDDRHRLFTERAAPGDAWHPNFDQFSGFVRYATGELPGKERERITAIRRRHGDVSGMPVRLFPRRHDAILLGGLLEFSGTNYQSPTTTVRAVYALSSGDDVLVADIRIDGQPRQGSLNLSKLSGLSGRCAHM